MMKKITLFFVFTMVAAVSAVAQSFVATYTFDSVKTTSGLTDPSPVPTATGITFGSFTAVGSSFTNSTGAGRFSFDHWPTGAVANANNYDTLSGSIDTTQYYNVTLTPSNGFDATLNGFTFSVRRSGTGVRTYAVRSSVDNFMTNLPASVIADTNISVEADSVFYLRYDVSTPSTGYNGSTITLSGSNFTNFTNAVSFRFYAWNSEASTGTFSIDTVIFTGSTTALTTGITSLNHNATVSIYPNPSTDGLFTVNTGNVQGTTQVAVYDLVGKVVYSTEVVAGKASINLSNHANGSYFVRVQNQNGVVTKKLILNK